MANEQEKKAYYELKRRMAGDMEKDLYEDDNVFYRFLRARDLNVDLAEAMLRKNLQFRKRYNAKDILEFNSPEICEKYAPAAFLGYTKNGDVLRYCPSGNVDSKALFSNCPITVLIKHLMKMFEEDRVALKKKSKELGRLVDKVVYIHNLKGLTFAKMTDRKVLFHFITLCNMYQDNYPETLRAIIGINTPAFFGFLYSVLKTLLPVQILKKIKIYTDDSWKQDILEIADPEIVPAFLGGTRTDPDGDPYCSSFISQAGIIPEECYIKKKLSFDSLPDIQKITVPRAAVHEVSLEIKESDALLEWEFKVKSGDIKFGIAIQNENEDKTEVLPMQKVSTDDDTETGFYECKNVGTYIIIFDNSYSFLRSKDIFYKMQVISTGI